ncbi:MAG: WYL domain-containing protein, partial [Pseudobutyrivibrio sp.]|nr:WYL domain-containing protein [Pseudobutyrivibrio sp.]
RIDLYFSHIPIYYDEDTEVVSIETISAEYEIPLSVVRMDIATIISAYKKTDDYLPFEPSNIDVDYDITRLISNITAGDWDALPLVKCVEKNTVNINLSEAERDALEAINAELGNSAIKSGIDINIKHNFKKDTAEEGLFEKLEAINKAINQRLQVFFAIKSEKTNRLSYHLCTPIKIIYDNEEGLYSLLCIKNKNYTVYNINKIEACSASKIPEDVNVFDDNVSSRQYIHILKQPAESYDDASLREKVPHVWKNAFEAKRATHVKVKFKAETYDSVLTDLFYRNPQLTLSPIADGYFYFEDDIFGIDAFDMWIRSFGSKAVILEPRSLAEKRIESLKLEYANYQ